MFQNLHFSETYQTYQRIQLGHKYVPLGKDKQIPTILRSNVYLHIFKN